MIVYYARDSTMDSYYTIHGDLAYKTGLKRRFSNKNEGKDKDISNSSFLQLIPFSVPLLLYILINPIYIELWLKFMNYYNNLINDGEEKL